MTPLHTTSGRPDSLSAWYAAMETAQRGTRRPVTPSLRMLQSALRETTERLARELPAPTATAPAWSDLEWRVARAAAAMHGVSGLLSARLRWEGPEGWETFLREQRTYTLQRQQQLAELYQTLDAKLREAGIGAVALTAAALHTLGLYAPGERAMEDLEILTEESDLERTAYILRGLGLAPLACTWRERTFAGVSQAPRNILGEHPGQALKVEVYTRICEKLPWRLTDISRYLVPDALQPGLNPYPSIPALMAHLLLNAAANMSTRALRLVQLQDLALLAGRMDADAWRELLDMRPGPGQDGPWWALPPLLLTARYYPCLLPEAVFKEISRWCQRPLRLACARAHLTDVSHSHLWIDAFPGLAWSRTVGELMAYMYGRINPGQAARRARSHARATEEWAAYNTWCRLSQRRRMLSFLVHRPARPVAIHPVLVSLGTP